MKVWRVTRKQHVKYVFKGEGAKRREGRWHRQGQKVVYSNPYSKQTQEIGARWLENGKSAVLSVPSAIVPAYEEKNYLLNPGHGTIRGMKILDIVPFRFDQRLFK